MAWSLFRKTAQAPPPSAVTSEIAVGEVVDINRYSDQIAREYVRSIYLWRSVDMIGQMASSVPLIITKSSNSQLTPQDRKVQELLVKPNPQWTGAALQYFVGASLSVANKAFLLRVRGASDVTLELWPISPSDVQVIYVTNTAMIKEFIVTWGGKVETYPVDDDGDSDIIYIRRPALSIATDKSPAAIAAAPAEVFTRILQRCADIVSNSSNITGLLSTESEIAKKAVEEIKDRITQFKTGRNESGGTLVTANAKWSLTRLSEDPASALSVEIKDSLARDVVMTFGVPTQLVGLPGTDTYNNIALARVGFLTDTVMPGYINLYVAGLNHVLMNGSGAQIVPDVEHIPAMISARQQMTEMAAKATMLSVNEQRALLGYAAYDDDEAANVPVKLEEMRLKRLAIEVQGGNVANILDKQPT